MFKSVAFAGLVVLAITFSACRTLMPEAFQKESVVPRGMKNAEEDRLRETSCVIKINDDSGAYFLGKDQVAKEQLGQKILERLRDASPDRRIVYIESAANVKYGTVVSLLEQIRKADVDRAAFLVERKDKGPSLATYTFAVKLPAEPDEREVLMVKPNPLTLVVELDKDRKIRLNNEDTGSISDPEKLTERLTLIFKQREMNGVLREGTNEVEKTIFIKAPRSSLYGDVVRVIDAMKGAGSQPIGLQLDDLEN